MVFYRKYRPQTLNEIIGQEHIKKTLEKAFISGHLAHGYLLCGPRGTGKTSTARILAKMVNCERNVIPSGVEGSHTGQSMKQVESDPLTNGRDDEVPCNECSSCISITDGSSLDLIEIDAASNRGIDDIRTLRETVKLSPVSSRKKVYIIDEVHMLTNEAFNALLKTLEEPPAHVLFILATTEIQKIPTTILSRVQKLEFKLASTEDLVKALERIVEKEQIVIDKEALLCIAKKSEGSFRDCQKLLDQLSSVGEKITVEMVEGLLKSGNFESLTKMVRSLSQQDTTQALGLIAEQVDGGANIKEFTLSLIDLLRSMLLIKNNAGQGVKEGLGSDKFQTVLELSKIFPEGALVRFINLFIESLEKMKVVTISSLLFEIAVVEGCKGSPSLVAHHSSPVVSQIVGSKDDVAPVSSVVTEVVSVPVAVSSGGGGDMNKLLDKWTYILESIRPYNFSLEALLKQVKILSCEEGVVMFEVPYSFHQRILETPKSRELLESVIADVLGRQVRVSCMLGTRPVRIEEIANVELAADDEVVRMAAEIFNS